MTNTGPSKTVRVSTGADVDPRFRYATTAAVSYNSGQFLGSPQSKQADQSKLAVVYNNWNDPSRNRETGFLLNQPTVVAYDKAVDESQWFSTTGTMTSTYTKNFTVHESAKASALPDKLLQTRGIVGSVQPVFSGSTEESGFTHNSPLNAPIANKGQMHSSSVTASDYGMPRLESLDMARKLPAPGDEKNRTSYVTESSKCITEQQYSLNSYDGKDITYQSTPERFESMHKHSFKDVSSYEHPMKSGELLRDNSLPTAYVKQEVCLFEKGHSKNTNMYDRPGYATVSPNQTLPSRDPLNKTEPVAGTLARQQLDSRVAPVAQSPVDAGHYVTETKDQFQQSSIAEKPYYSNVLTGAALESGFVSGSNFASDCKPRKNLQLQKLHPTVQKLLEVDSRSVDPVRPTEQLEHALLL